MTNQHPITPPPELVEQWEAETACVAVKAARWGADQELQACCEQLDKLQLGTCYPVTGDKLRATRRPRPPSLKEQALDELTSAERLYPADWSTIRRALEALPND
jgi:hypothetical protein